MDGEHSKSKSFLLAVSFSLYIIPVTDSQHNMQISLFIPQCNESTDTRQQLLFTSFIYCNILFYAIFVLQMPLICFKWQYLQLTDSTTWLNIVFCQIAACCYASNTSRRGVETRVVKELLSTEGIFTVAAHWSVAAVALAEGSLTAARLKHRCVSESVNLPNTVTTALSPQNENCVLLMLFQTTCDFSVWEKFSEMLFSQAYNDKDCQSVLFYHHWYTVIYTVCVYFQKI